MGGRSVQRTRDKWFLVEDTHHEEKVQVVTV